MSQLPKLKIKLPGGYPREEICELAEAENRLDFVDGVILVEGQSVHSRNELIQMVTQDKYKNKEYIEVVILSIIDGG
jgi:hypothetical protein